MSVIVIERGIIVKKFFKKNIIKDIVIFICTFIVFITVFHFIRFPSVTGNSMEPTYSDNDRLIVLYTTDVKVNDIAVVWCDKLNEYIVKRIIGVGGDHIEIKNKHLYRNGVQLYETYINDQDWFDEMDYVNIVVPEGEIFVLGDNRRDSADSRMFGTLSQSDVFGKVLCRGNFINVIRKGD